MLCCYCCTYCKCYQWWCLISAWNFRFCIKILKGFSSMCCKEHISESTHDINEDTNTHTHTKIERKKYVYWNAYGTTVWICAIMMQTLWYGGFEANTHFSYDSAKMNGIKRNAWEPSRLFWNSITAIIISLIEYPNFTSSSLVWSTRLTTNIKWNDTKSRQKSISFQIFRLSEKLPFEILSCEGFPIWDKIIVINFTGAKCAANLIRMKNRSKFCNN